MNPPGQGPPGRDETPEGNEAPGDSKAPPGDSKAPPRDHKTSGDGKASHEPKAPAAETTQTSMHRPVRPGDRDIPSFEAERIPAWTVILAPILAAVVASPGLGNHLLSDDFALLSGNLGQSAMDLVRPFLHESTSRAAGGTYRPLTEVSVGLDYFLWGRSPFGFHLVNLLWHVLNTLLCFAFVRVLVPPRPVVALTAAVLFAVHPVHADAIFWLSARSDLLVTFFYVASLLLFVRGRGPEKRRVPTVGSVLCFVAALLSKEVALSLPLLVVILDLASPSTESFRHRMRRHMLRYLVYIAVALAYLGLRLTVLPTIGQAEFPGLVEGLFNFALYFKLMLLPMETNTGLRGVVVVVLVVIVVVVMFLRYARMGDRRNLLFGVAWMVTIILPILDVPRRWQLYMPSVGFCIFFAIVLAGLIWRRDEYHSRRVSRVSGVALFLLLSGGAMLLYYHATVYGRAGTLGQRIIAQLQKLEPNPPAGYVITAANLPAVITSWSGNQPVFAFGFSEALKLAYGRTDISGQVLSTLYVEDSQQARPGASRLAKDQLQFDTGGGAYSFSFHTSRFTTGRDLPRKGEVLQFGRWTTRIDKVEEREIKRIVVKPRGGRKLGTVYVWNGDRMVRLKPKPRGK